MIYSFTVKSNLSRGSGQWNSEKHSSSQCFITVLYNHPDHSSAQSKSLLSHLWNFKCAALFENTREASFMTMYRINLIGQSVCERKKEARMF